MVLVNAQERRLMLLQCTKENVLNMLQEHRMLGERYNSRMHPQSQMDVLTALNIAMEMDQMRMQVFQIIINTVPDLVSSDEEIRLVSEMIELMVAASNEFNTDQVFYDT